MKDYAIISLHEKGFWQVVVYWKLDGPPDEGDSPCHFKTCGMGDTIEDAREWIERWYPNAEVHVAEDEETDKEELP
jgi:hypothetical protein